MLISVVIPTYQRPDLLSQCLDRLCFDKQTLGPNFFEIIVSDDSRNEISKQLIQKEYLRVKWVQGPRRGPASNRNNGAKHALGEWLAFLDDDCLPDSGWLLSLFNSARDDGAIGVIEGKTVCPDKGDSPFEDYIENLSGGQFWSCNLAIRRALFFQLGGFDELFLEAGGEDMEFAWRLREHQVKSLFVPGFLVLHPARRLTWRQVWWRTLLIRWVLLYRLRTGKAAPLDTSGFQVIYNISTDRISDLLRTTVHFVSRFNSQCWRRSLVWQIWKWFTFPVILPYLIVWEFRFREILKAPSKPLLSNENGSFKKG
jgi:GT2 family glycosyltransferase